MRSRGLHNSISCNRNSSRSYVPQLRWQNVKSVTARWVQGNVLHNLNFSIAQFMLKMLSILFSASLFCWFLNFHLGFFRWVDLFLLYRERSNAISCLALSNGKFRFCSAFLFPSIIFRIMKLSIWAMNFHSCRDVSPKFVSS